MADSLNHVAAPETPEPQRTLLPQMGLGKLSDWANVCACGVMFFLFYQAQQNAFEMYRQDKAEARESMRMLWETTRKMQEDGTRQTEQLRQMQGVMADMQQVNREMLTEIKTLRNGRTP